MLELCRRVKLREDEAEFDRFCQLVKETTLNINCTGEDKKGRTPLMELCYYNRSVGLDGCIGVLLQQRPDINVNQTDNEGMTALMILCEYSRSSNIVKAARLLINSKADVNKKDKGGKKVADYLNTISSYREKYKLSDEMRKELLKLLM